MIKVIKPGYREFKRIYVAKCEKCSCSFEFEYEDLQFTGILKVPFINCPCCKKTIKFDEESLYFNSVKVPVKGTEIVNK